MEKLTNKFKIMKNPKFISVNEMMKNLREEEAKYSEDILFDRRHKQHRKYYKKQRENMTRNPNHTDLEAMSKVALEQMKVPRLTHRFGTWYVSETGDMLSISNGLYLIQDDALEKKQWILHMLEKSWCDMNEFIPAYLQAFKNTGIKKPKINLYY